MFSKKMFSYYRYLSSRHRIMKHKKSKKKNEKKHHPQISFSINHKRSVSWFIYISYFIYEDLKI